LALKLFKNTVKQFRKMENLLETKGLNMELVKAIKSCEKEIPTTKKAKSEILEKMVEANEKQFTKEEIDSLVVKEIARLDTEEEKKAITSRVQSALKVIANKGTLNSTDFDYLIDNAKIGHFENREFFVRKNGVNYHAKFDGLVCELIRKDAKNESLSAPLRQLVVKGSCENWLCGRGFELLKDGGKEFKKELAGKVKSLAASKAKSNEIDKLSEKFVGAKLDTRVYRMAIKIKMA
jgi:hypothetical protein